MARRYLTKTEISSAVRRGKQVDAFLGAGECGDVPTIRYLTAQGTSGRIYAELWEVEDPRDPEFLDVYNFCPPNGDDAPDRIFVFESVLDALVELDKIFPWVSLRFVNQGVIDDEYAEYLAK